MSPFIENLVVSLVTGAAASSTAVLNGTHDWPIIVATGVVAAAGSLVNGLRQLQKTP